ADGYARATRSLDRSRREQVAATDLHRRLGEPRDAVVRRRTLAALTPVRDELERRAPLGHWTRDERLARVRGAGARAGRDQREPHGRAKDDRRILGGRAPLGAAARTLEPLRTTGPATRPERVARARPRSCDQALLRTDERDLRRRMLCVGQQGRIR